MRMWKVIVSSAVIGALSVPALAQDGQKPQDGKPAARQPRGPGGPGGPGGPTLSPEAAKAAWELEAKGVAASLGLDADKTSALVAAYADARTSQGAAADKLRKEAMEEMQKHDGEDMDQDARREQFQKMREKSDKLNADEKAKFAKALSDKLGSAETTKAVDMLGTFDRGWDNMVDSIAGFKLDADKQGTALKAIQSYVANVAKARTGSDREAIRTAMGEYRDNLEAALKPVLTDEQMTKFKASMGGGRGGFGGGPRGGGGGGNRN